MENYKVYLFGYPDYSFGKKDKKQKTEKDANQYRNQRFWNNEGSISSLPGTRKEIESIVTLLKQAKIPHGEGIFGLQRAFLQAGAKSILVSFWKVDDAATQEMMRLFYENLLIEKQEKHVAFANSQKKLRDPTTGELL
jgi:CHAT domain-containing protein